MSGQLGEIFEKTKKYDPITTQFIEEVFQNDSDNMEGIGRAIGWDQLERDARWNQQNSNEGIANASIATGLGFLGAGAGNWMGAGASAAPGAGVVAPGMQNAAMLDTMLINAGYPQAAGGMLTSWAGGGAAGAGDAVKLMQAAQMVAPQQPQPMMAARPPAQQQYEPLPMYGQGYGNYGMGMPKMPEFEKDPRFMTEEEKRKRLLMRQRQF